MQKNTSNLLRNTVISGEIKFPFIIYSSVYDLYLFVVGSGDNEDVVAYLLNNSNFKEIKFSTYFVNSLCERIIQF